jgi:hypothetical protein
MHEPEDRRSKIRGQFHTFVQSRRALGRSRGARATHMLSTALATLCTLGLLASTTVTSSAQAARLQVTDVRAVQVVEDVPLVVGKTTVVKVNLTASIRTDARVSVTLGSGTNSTVAHLSSGANVVYLYVNPPAAPGTVNFSARVTSLSGSGGNTVSRQAQVVALRLNSMKILLMPVDWTSQDRARYLPGLFNTFASSSGDFLRATYPFPDGNIQISSTSTPFMLTPDQRAISDSVGNLNWGVITDMYSAVAIAGRRIMPNADLVVGVLPPRWFARAFNDPTTVGFELNAVNSVVSTQVDSDYATLAHETGHHFGRIDDYNFDVSPPKIGNRIDVSGYWIARARQVNPWDRPVYYSFMGASDAKSQYWVDKSTYLAILQALQNGVGP